MRKTLAIAITSTLALAACTNGSYADADLLKNPLYAEFYYDDLVETMVSVQLNDPKALENNDRLETILEDVRRTGLQKAKEANDRQDEGTSGNMIQVKHFAQGEVLFVDNMIYTSPDFVVAPGPELHVFLSKDVDPRESEAFPTTQDIDIGLLKSPYGPQEMPTPADLDKNEYRSLVVYDVVLKRMHAFTQLTK